MIREIRYSDLLPIDPLRASHCVIVGCGAIGRQLALSLATMGVTNFHLYDPDTVSVENLGTQGWAPSDMDMSKPGALCNEILRINPDANVELRECRFSRSHVRSMSNLEQSFHIFSCVDSMRARHDIATWLINHGQVDWTLYDARMSAEFMEIRAFPLPSLPDFFESIVPDSEAYTESCTNKSTFYCAAIAANLLVHQFTRSLRNLTLHPPYQYSLINNMLLPFPSLQISDD